MRLKCFLLFILFIKLLHTGKVTLAQDELSLLATLHGEKKGDYFSQVASIGDINRDGYDDFLVSGGGYYVKIYPGSSTFDTANCIKLYGIPHYIFKSSTGKGDLNGDGYDDYALSVSYYADDSRIQIYFGGPVIDTIPDIILINNIYYSGFGSLSVFGDFNNDGYDDLATGAKNDDFDARGRVYIYFGGKEMDTEYDVYLEGKEAFDTFGNSISNAGDTNGDGFDDLIVGAPHSFYTQEKYPGKAYLFYGGDSIGFNNSEEFIDDSSYRNFGNVVAGLGDINGDGYADFGIINKAHARIFSGKTLENILTHEFNTNPFIYINRIPDLNKDGYGDYALLSGTNKIYFGNELPDTISEFTINTWGYPFYPLGDINGDSLPDIAVGRSYGPDPIGQVDIFSFGKLTSINEKVSKPDEIELYNNYPNPFNPSTIINYNISVTGYIIIRVYDILGREITNLVNEVKQPGNYKVNFDGNNLPSGVYLLKLEARPLGLYNYFYQKTLKMTLQK